MNELDTVLEQLYLRYAFEVIFVNDGSHDTTYDNIIAETKKRGYVRLIDLSRNFGNQIAVTAGINEAGGDAIITMDGDRQHPPPVIPDLIEEWEKGYEIVQAKRIYYENPGIFKNVLSSLYFVILNRISKVRIEKEISDFRLLDRKVAAYFRKVAEKDRFVRGIVNWLGFRKSYVEYEVPPRLEGNTTFSIGGLFRLALAGMTSFSLVPLKIASLLGLLITLFSSVLLVWMGYVYLFVSKSYVTPNNAPPAVFAGAIQVPLNVPVKLSLYASVHVRSAASISSITTLNA